MGRYLFEDLIMDYSIASGDTLWNIAKTHYNCETDADVSRMVSEI